MTQKLEDLVVTARCMANLTQEQASEKLSNYLENHSTSGREGISWRTISRYENGSPIPEDILLAMAVVYQSPGLLWVYLSSNNEVGKKILPEIKLIELPTAIGCLEMIVGEIPEEIQRFRKAAFERRLNGEVNALLKMLKVLIGVSASCQIAIEKEKTVPADKRWRQLSYKIAHEKSPLCRAD